MSVETIKTVIHLASSPDGGPSCEIFVKGMSLCGSVGDDSPIYLEYYEGKWWLRVWADINQEDPTHSIDMSGALESRRNVGHS